MFEIDPSFHCHKLAICKDAKPVTQRKRKMGKERYQVVQQEVVKLMAAQFIREINYSTWLSNMVMVKKPNDKWRMCTDYTNLNRACSKDAYLLPNIDWLVDGVVRHKMLSFLDAYSDYNQSNVSTFVSESTNFCFKVMPFKLKNVRATYQHLMEKLF